MNFNKKEVEVIRKLIILKIRENVNNLDKNINYVDGCYHIERISTSFLMNMLSKVDKTSYSYLQEIYSKYLHNVDKKVIDYDSQIKF